MLLKFFNKTKNEEELEYRSKELNGLQYYIFLLPLLTIFIVEFLHRGSIINLLKWAIGYPSIFLFNYIFYFSILNLFTFIGNGKYYFLSSSLIIICLGLLGKIGYFKENFRGESLYLSDFKLVKEAFDMAQFYDINVVGIITFICVILLVLSAIFINKITLAPKSIISKITSAVSLILGTILIASSLNISNVFRLRVQTDNTMNHEANGILPGLYLEAKFLNIKKPTNYSKEKVNEIISSITTNENSAKVKPNVIYVLLETFYDIDKMTNLEVNSELTPNFNKYKKEGIYGRMTVPNMGGGTANTEFEVLTGLSKNYISDLDVPYTPFNQYIKKPTTSMASILKEVGYDTIGIHTHASWFYNRNSVYKNLGIDKFIASDTFEKKPLYYSTYIDDKEAYSLALNRLNETKNPDFINIVTMMGHGGYTDISMTDESIQVTSNLDKNHLLEVTNYARLTHSVDKRFGEFIEEVKKLKEPTIVVAYGDHSPSLSHEILDTIAENESVYTSMPYMIWSNYNAFPSEEINISASDMPSMVLNKIGYTDNVIMSLKNKIQNSNGTEKEQLIEALGILQYDMLHGNRYIYDFIEEPAINENYTVGNKISIESAFIENRNGQEYLIVTGNGFTHNGTLKVNGKELEYSMSDGKSISTEINKGIKNSKVVIDFESKNSRGGIVQKAESYVTTKDSLYNNPLAYNFWEELYLDGQQYWFPFTNNDEMYSFYLDLELKETTYSAQLGKVNFEDTYANNINAPYQADIYENGNIYVSVPAELIEDKNNPLDSFKKLMNQQNIILRVRKQ